MQKKPKIHVQTSHKILIPENYPEVPKLRHWDVHKPENKLPEGFFIICEGSRRSGKSVFLKWLLYWYKNEFDLAVVMSETPHNGFWQPLVSADFVHGGWNPFLVEKLFERQTHEIEKEKKRPGYHAKKVLIILDDIVGDRRHIHEDATLNRLAVEGRHFKISICLTTQEPHAIGTALRNNCDIAIIFQQKSKRAKASVCEDFLMYKLEYTWQAEDLLRTYTMKHDCILIHMHELDPDPTLTYFHVPASMTFDETTNKIRVPDYQIGSDEQKQAAKTPQGKLPIFSSNIED